MIPPNESFNEQWIKSISQNDFIVFMLDHNTKHSETDLKGIYNSIVPHIPVTVPSISHIPEPVDEEKENTHPEHED